MPAKERSVAKAAGLKRYVTGRPCPHGHTGPRATSSGQCVECTKARQRRWSQANREHVQKKWDDWHAKNPDARDAAREKYQKNNREKLTRMAAARAFRVRLATPPWAELEAIAQFYLNTPVGMSVDHVIPLKHRLVCGLHVRQNLQYLPAESNRAKSNEYVVGSEGIVITAHTPWREDGNLGAAYNEIMQEAKPGSWVIFKDHDAMFVTGKWCIQFMEAIALKPDAGAFVAMTNRIASSWQRCGDQSNNDMQWHRRFGQERLRIRTLLDITNTKGWGGVAFAINRDVWSRLGGFAEGLGCVDHSIHFKIQKAGLKVWLIEGLYLYHWRHWGEQDPTSIFPKAANCECRGAEKMPTERITLP